MWQVIGRDLVRLVAEWWRVDRIRVSSDEGRLLRLQPPCLVVVAGRPAEVLSRIVGHDAGGTFVAYDCRGVQGMCRLRVGLVDDRAASDVSWTADGVQRQLHVGEVETFMPGRRRSTVAESADECGSQHAGQISW